MGVNFSHKILKIFFSVIRYYLKWGSCFRKPPPLIRHREKISIFFPEFFYEYFVKGIEPPYGLS